MLRWVPTWAIGHYKTFDPNVSVGDADRTFAELQLRRAIRDDLLAGADELVERMRRHSETEVMRELSTSLGGDDPLAMSAYGGHSEHRMQGVQGEDAFTLRQMIVALLVADALADDSYVDARLTAEA